MTVATTAGSNLPVVPNDAVDGLEDFDAATDARMPRIKIDHKKAVFVNNLTKEELPTIKVVIMGLIKQRILWDSDVEEGDKPMCRSLDYTTGLPKLAEPKAFPWADSGFDLSNFQPDSDGVVELPCASCKLKEWGSSKPGNPKSPPACAEQHTFPLALLDEQNGGITPALLTVQKTGIKPSKDYVSGFAMRKAPMFTVWTELSLRAEKRGSVDYAVPIFKKGEATDTDEHAFYSQTYRSIRAFVTSRPDPKVEVVENEDTHTGWEGDAAAAEPTPTPAPAAAVPPPPAPPAPAPAAAPAAPVPPIPAPPAPAAPAAPAPAPAAAAPQTPVASAPDDDDLPF